VVHGNLVLHWDNENAAIGHRDRQPFVFSFEPDFPLSARPRNRAGHQLRPSTTRPAVASCTFLRIRRYATLPAAGSNTQRYNIEYFNPDIIDDYFSPG
jgi:hypothetical protein